MSDFETDEEWERMRLSGFIESARYKWTDSPCRQRLLERLAANRPRDGWKISKAVLMALGDLFHKSTSPTGLSADRVRNLIVFLDVVRYLRQSTGSPIKTYAQDPDFTPQTVEWLQEYGVEVLWCPQGENTINTDTFVYAPYYGGDFEFLGHPRPLSPTLYIGNPPAHHVWYTELQRAGDQRNFARTPNDETARLLEIQQAITEHVADYDRRSDCFALCEPTCRQHRTFRALEVVFPLRDSQEKRGIEKSSAGLLVYVDRNIRGMSPHPQDTAPDDQTGSRRSWLDPTN